VGLVSLGIVKVLKARGKKRTETKEFSILRLLLPVLNLLQS
jgi:uncharacterized membrane protein